MIAEKSKLGYIKPLRWNEKCRFLTGEEALSNWQSRTVANRLITSSGILNYDGWIYAKIYPMKSNAIAGEIEETLKAIESLQVNVPNISKTREYLLSHTDMIVTLVDVCSHVSAHFFGKAQVSLEVYRDPEIDWEDLTLYIRQNEYSRNLMQEIEEVSDGLPDVIRNLSGLLTITTDFQSPR